MIFCPNCANMLTISAASGNNKWCCATCPYEYPLETTYTERTHLDRKLVDDVLGGADSWANVDSTAATCIKCSGERAYFMMIQTRGGDEPSTQYFKCCNNECNYQWKEN